MNRVIAAVLVTLCFSSFSTLAQDPGANVVQLSASTKQYLWKAAQLAKDKPAFFPEYIYRKDQQEIIYVSVLIAVNPSLDETVLESQGISVETKAGNIWTIRVPLEKMNDLINTSGIEYIDMDRPAFVTLDSARKTTRADSVQKGYGLPQGYSGDGIVVGIIDEGFDYTHPTFYDTTYSQYRIKRVWEEKTTGTPPPGFSYGSEYTDSASIISKAYDVDYFTHGTHVAGIAAGSGFGSASGNQRFRGMAYGSDLVMVAINPTSDYWLTTGMADMLDGIHYIFNYADEVSKPAVVNLSWGALIGPHDGTSLFSQACDNLTGAGRIFVLSAGNSGLDTLHLRKTFSSNDSLVNTFVGFSPYLPFQKNLVDIWGDISVSYCIQFSLYNGSAKTDSSVFFCLDDATNQISIVGSDGDTCFISLTTVSSEFNGKPHMLMDIYSLTNDHLCFTIKGTEGTIDLWQGYVYNNSGYAGSFSSRGFPWAVNGNSDITISDLVSTESAISVGAYNSKPSFHNVLGQNLYYPGYTKGALSLFSSHGPTADGRVRPDITGPGLALASSVSSVDSIYFPGGDSYGSVIANFISPLNGNTYRYAMLAGTSMSSPAVSGIIALLLQVNPLLTPQDIKDILGETAITDNFTGTIPVDGSNTWGFGKVNAYKALISILPNVGIFHTESTLHCLLYPNPGSGTYAMEYVSDKVETLQLSIFDVTGRRILHSLWKTKTGSNFTTFDLSDQANGLYLVKIEGDYGSSHTRIMKQ